MNPIVKEMTGIGERTHNIIFYEHADRVCNFLEAQCPLTESDAIDMMLMHVGISEKFVKAYIRSLVAWKIVMRKGNMLYWMIGDKKNKIPESPLQKDVQAITESDKAIESDNTIITQEDNKPLAEKKCLLGNPDNHFKHCMDKKPFTSCKDCEHHVSNRV